VVSIQSCLFSFLSCAACLPDSRAKISLFSPPRESFYLKLFLQMFLRFRSARSGLPRGPDRKNCRPASNCRFFFQPYSIFTSIFSSLRGIRSSTGLTGHPPPSHFDFEDSLFPPLLRCRIKSAFPPVTVETYSSFHYSSEVTSRIGPW